MEKLDLIDIFSATPRDPLFDPLSWKIQTGFTRKTLADGEDHLLYSVTPGLGVAYRGGSSGIGYLMLEGDLGVTGGYEEGFALGLGPGAGWLQRVTDGWKVNLSAGILDYEIGDRHRSRRASLEQVFAATRNNGVNLTYPVEEGYGFPKQETSLFWNFYF